LFAAITIRRFVKVFYEAGPGRQYLNPSPNPRLSA
jgi:hypothetical protein